MVNEERTGSWLKQTEQFRGHLWNRYSLKSWWLLKVDFNFTTTNSWFSILLVISNYMCWSRYEVGLSLFMVCYNKCSLAHFVWYNWLWETIIATSSHLIILVIEESMLIHYCAINIILFCHCAFCAEQFLLNNIIKRGAIMKIWNKNTGPDFNQK